MKKLNNSGPTDGRKNPRRLISQFHNSFVEAEHTFWEDQKIYTPKDVRCLLEENGIPKTTSLSYTFHLLNTSEDGKHPVTTARAKAAYFAAKKAKEEGRPPLSSYEMEQITRAIEIIYSPRKDSYVRVSVSIRPNYDGDPNSLPLPMRGIHDELLPILKSQRWDFEAIKNACERGGVALRVNGSDFEKLYALLHYMFPRSRAIMDGKLSRVTEPQKAERPSAASIKRMLKGVDIRLTHMSA